MDVTRLKQSRQGYRLNVRRVLDQISQNYTNRDTTPPEQADSIHLKNRLAHYTENIEKLNTEIAPLVPNDEFEDESNTCLQLQEELWDAEYRLSAMIDSPVIEPAVGQPALGVQSDAISEYGSASPRYQHARLPKLDLDKFSGKTIEWQEYWDGFSETIDKSDLPKIDKFKYLKGTLEGDAARMVDGFRLIEANYDTVCDALKQRFGNPEIAIFAHFEQLLALSQATGETHSLQNIFDECERHIRSLVALGMAEDTFGKVFTPIILSKLPRSLRIELHRRNGGKPWEIQVLRDLFREELQARQMGDLSINGKRDPFSSSKDQRNQNRQVGHSAHRPPSVSTFIQNSEKPGKWVQKGSITPGPKSSVSCIYCSGNHFSDQCFRHPTYEARKQLVEKAGCCFKCLSTKHRAKDCPKMVKCFYCSMSNHHSSLCRNRGGAGTTTNNFVVQAEHPRSHNGYQGRVNTAPTNGQTTSGGPTPMNPNAMSFQPTKNASSHAAAADGCSVFMQMACVAFRVGNKDIKARIYLDPGSSCSYVTTDLSKKLGLKPQGSMIVSNARFADPNRSVKSYQTVYLSIPILGNQQIQISAFVTQLISPPVQKLSLDPDMYPIITQLPLADYAPSQPKWVSIDIMIGQDHYYDFVNSEIIRLHGGLNLVGSKFGYITAGKVVGARVSDRSQSFFAAGFLNFSSAGPRFGNLDLERFWSLEEIGIRDDCYTKDDDMAVQLFNESIKRVDGRYQVGWPWREKVPDLPENYDLALARLRATTRKLQQKPDLLKEYSEIIDKQLETGTIELVTEGPGVALPAVKGSLIHYLPHHCVVKPTSATTKVRVVHDASSKSSKHSLSLNECLLRGPVYLSDLCGLLLRFRLHKVAFVSDIEKAFFQVGLQASDRDVTRFLWLKDPTRPVSPSNLITYRFTKVLFGVIASLFLLEATVRHHLIHDGSQVARDTASNLYVDNVICGRSTVKEAKEFFDEARRLFADIKMNLREWFTNSRELRDAIPTEIRGSDTHTRVLGMSWNTNDDYLGYPATSIADIEVRTKRHLVQAMPMVYDPCGFLSPAVLKGKLLIQEAWRRQLKWDDGLPPDMLESWKTVQSELEGISNTKIPRFLGGNIASTWNMHCFCDASSKAYAAVVYVKPPSGKAQLVFAKSKLAPLKSITLPRLELMAIVIGVRLIKFVKEQLGIQISNVYVWSDSKCSLQWIDSSKLLSVFVSNRVREIKKIEANFRYVPTKLNPADLPTRGISVCDLHSMSTWWHGPDFLSVSSENWPPNDLGKLEVTASGEEAVSVPTLVNNTSAEVSQHFCTIEPHRFSSLRKLLRVSHLVHRFIALLRCRMQAKRTPQNPTLSIPPFPPTSTDLASIKQHWVFYVQKNSILNCPKFRNLKIQLQLFQDKSGLFRCGGRMKHADMTEDAKFPVLLPKNHPFTKLVIKQCHERVHHSGAAHTIAEVRAQFWVPSLRSQVQSVIRACQICRLWEGGPYKCPPHPPLPGYRVTKVIPFQYTGVDYLGPLLVDKSGNSGKVWICLFTCTATRAIHLEVVNDLSTDQFLLSFRRFIALYGQPNMMISDNGKYFRLASDVLKSLWADIVASKSVQNFCSDNGIQWKFITEYSPWMGGFYERLVGSVKRSLKKLLGRQQVPMPQLQTIVAEIASVLNSRPLLVSTDTNDQVLTPADLLGKTKRTGLPVCRPGDYKADEPYVERQTPRDRLVGAWKESEAKLKLFWDIWRSEYLPTLRETHKTVTGPHGSANFNPKVGAVVLIHDSKLSRSVWKTGVVLELVKSFDGVVRSAVLKICNGNKINRPIKLLFPIEGEIKPDKSQNTTGNTSSRHMTDTEQTAHSKTQNSDSKSGSDIADTDNHQSSRPRRQTADLTLARIQAQAFEEGSDEEPY